MSNWFRELVQLLRNLNRLRPHIRPNRWLVFGVVVAATSSAVFEMAGIGLLVPLIALFQNPPEQVLQGEYIGRLPRMFPGKDGAFFVWLFATFVIVAIAAKNVLTITYQRLQAEVAGRRRTADFFDALRQHDSGELQEAGPAGCDSDKCLLPLAKPEN